MGLSLGLSLLSTAPSQLPWVTADSRGRADRFSVLGCIKDCCQGTTEFDLAKCGNGPFLFRNGSRQMFHFRITESHTRTWL